MKLRQWQAEAISRAYEQYCSNIRHFMCLATPGAGKTIVASLIAQQLFESDMIDMVICLSPSIVVAQDFQLELEKWTQRSMNGRLGSSGCSLTYQSMSLLDESFWKILNTQRVFTIFDEIHHCAAVEDGKSNRWGEAIHRYIRGKAAYSLALTGTPWRSDSTPIVLSDYCGKTGVVQCDYRYGIARAVTDNVCRLPVITTLDNREIRVTQGTETNRYYSLKELLEQSNCCYQEILENDALIISILDKSIQKLDSLRKMTPNAGGLIVTTSVRHARQVAKLLLTEFGISAEIATCAEADPLATIRQFRNSENQWIISIGMISEGTNLPRLQVCCYLSRVKTELYFRQVLGRILRVTSKKNEIGYFYMPAEPKLIEYAQRVAEDLPESSVLNAEYLKPITVAENEFLNPIKQIREAGKNTEFSDSNLNRNSIYFGTEIEGQNKTLRQSYEACIEISNFFTQKVLKTNIFR